MSTDSAQVVDELHAPDEAELNALPQAPEEDEAAYAASTDQKHDDFEIWKQCASYREPKKGARPVGFLRKGRNYFYYQRQFKNVMAVDGKYRSTWWALTDDDRGYKRVWVSCIYFKGGANDQPVKRLPIK